MGRYSNPDIVTRLRRILSGQGRDRVSHRPVPSLRQKQTRLTDSQRSELVDRYRAGESANALAAEFGVDRRTLVGHLRREGVEVRYRVVDRVDLAEAARLYRSGRSLAVVAAQLGVSAGTVLRVLRSAGVQTRAVGTNQWSTS
jgi:predicted DNA binding protein